MKINIIITSILFLLSIEGFTKILPSFKNISSKAILKEAHTLLQKNNFRNINILSFEKNLSKFQTSKIINIANLMDKALYPQYLHWLRNLNPNISYPKLTLIFDHLGAQNKAFTMRIYPEKYNLFAITLDINSIFDKRIIFSLIHEIQHVLNNYYRVGSNSIESDWINEGLSEFFTYHFSKILPNNELNSFKNSYFSNSLIHLDNISYTPAFLFITWMYYHFGKDKFIFNLLTNKKDGIHNLTNLARLYGFKNYHFSDKFYTFKSLYTNFSFSLLLNSKKVGKNYFFSLSGKTYHHKLSSIKLTPLFLSLNPLNEDQLEQRIKPFQTYTYNIVPINYCYTIIKGKDVFIYKIFNLNNKTTIKKIFDQVCVSSQGETKLLINHLGKRESFFKIIPY